MELSKNLIKRGVSYINNDMSFYFINNNKKKSK